MHAITLRRAIHELPLLIMSKIKTEDIPSIKGGNDVSLHYTLSVVQASKVRSNLLKPMTPQIEESLSGSDQSAVLWMDMAKWFGEDVRSVLDKIRTISFHEVEEIRLRVGQPLLVRTSDSDLFLNREGRVSSPDKAYFVNREDLACALERMTHSSLYAAEEDLKQVLPDAELLGETRYRALVNMVYNLGINRFIRFKKMLKTINDGDFDRAADEMLDSLWHKQVGKRAERIAGLMRND